MANQFFDRIGGAVTSLVAVHAPICHDDDVPVVTEFVGIDPLDEQLGARLERRAVHINANLTGLRVGPGVQLQHLDLLREPCYRRASGARFFLAWFNYKRFRVYIKPFF